MSSISDYEKQKQIDYLAWQWFPRSFGFWSWYVSTLFFWKSQQNNLDIAATIGLGIGILLWLILKLIHLIIGSRIIYTYLWEYGCGCLVKAFVIELFQYLGIASVCYIAFRSGELTLILSIIMFVVGMLNWFWISFKNI